MAIRKSDEKMVIINEGEAKQMANLYGTSNDVKPTVGYTNGSVFLEVDTGKIFLFNESTSSWVEFK